MNDNRQIISFPFKPHLAQYLFYQVCTEKIEYEETHKHRPLEINLKAIDGQIIRLILEKADYPDVNQIEKGFRLWVSVPRKAWRNKLFDDARYQELRITPEAIELINGMYEVRFEDHMHSFIAGYVRGHGKGGIKKAILLFIDIYDLPEEEYNYESIRKMYQRNDSPLKEPVYEKKNKNSGISKRKKADKPFINRYLKR